MKVLIIIPCYNEEFRLATDTFYKFSIKHPNIHFLFVDDGSTDNTLGLLQSLCNARKNLNYLNLNQNLGKAEAIRNGILSVNNANEEYTFIGYFDADLSVPLKEIEAFLDIIKKNNEVEFILGIRVARLGAQINRNLFRHYFGRVFATTVSIILKENVYDSQCGAKLIHCSLIHKLFQDPFISKWIFDVELLFRFKMIYTNCNDKIIEYPINEWSEIAGSKIKIKYYLLAPIELFKIWFRYRQFN